MRITEGALQEALDGTDEGGEYADHDHEFVYFIRPEAHGLRRRAWHEDGGGNITLGAEVVLAAKRGAKAMRVRTARHTLARRRPSGPRFSVNQPGEPVELRLLDLIEDVSRTDRELGAHLLAQYTRANSRSASPERRPEPAAMMLPGVDFAPAPAMDFGHRPPPVAHHEPVALPIPEPTLRIHEMDLGPGDCVPSPSMTWDRANPQGRVEG